MPSPTPTRRPKPPRQRLLGLIHQRLKLLGADSDSPRYQQALAAAGAPLRPQADGTERRSAADLDEHQLAAVHAALSGGDGTGPGPWRPSPKPESVSDKQWRYVGDLVVRLHMDEQRFARFVRHETGLERWQWLDTPTCRTLIAGLLALERAPSPRRRVPARGNPRRRP